MKLLLLLGSSLLWSQKLFGSQLSSYSLPNYDEFSARPLRTGPWRNLKFIMNSINEIVILLRMYFNFFFLSRPEKRRNVGTRMEICCTVDVKFENKTTKTRKSKRIISILMASNCLNEFLKLCLNFLSVFSWTTKTRP